MALLPHDISSITVIDQQSSILKEVRMSFTK